LLHVHACGGITSQILACVLYPDLQVQRDSIFALANIADSVEFQNDVVREGGIEVLVKSGLSDDARVQRDTARAFSALTLPEHLKRFVAACTMFLYFLFCYCIARLFTVTCSKGVLRLLRISYCNGSQHAHKGLALPQA
jgi:hypothetical protein